MWTQPDDLKRQVQRLWDRGVLPREVITGGRGFPLKLSFKGPSSKDLTDGFEGVRDGVLSLRSVKAYRLCWREVRHRVHGQQSIPHEVWIDSLNEALTHLGKQREAAILRGLLNDTLGILPELMPWLEHRPLLALSLSDDWRRLLLLAQWIKAHPRPHIYLRQFDVRGVDTKFIEAHRGILGEWIPWIMADGVGRSPVRASHFTLDLGFLEKPARVRFRSLDPHLRLLNVPTPNPDMTLDSETFSCLDIEVSRVFILENEINFLAFPPVPQSMAIFGAGYGFEALSKAHWLRASALYYWGDIDTHGFAILDQLRAYFPEVISILMDRETLLAHEAHWGQEQSPTHADRERLSPEERQLYQDLRYDLFGERLRLEQERIGYQWVCRAIDQLMHTRR